jgi:hypothetical protein
MQVVFVVRFDFLKWLTKRSWAPIDATVTLSRRYQITHFFNNRLETLALSLYSLNAPNGRRFTFYTPKNNN